MTTDNVIARSWMPLVRWQAVLGAPHEVIDLRPVGALLTGSALTDNRVEVPRGHYTDKSMRRTVVPNRNAIMLDIATGIAVARGADAVAFGAHGGDHPIYPDCRPEFVREFTEMVRVANAGFISSRFWAENASGRRPGGPQFVRQARDGLPLTVAGDGSQTRSLCFVSDLVGGLLAVAAHDTAGPVNLGNPRRSRCWRWLGRFARCADQHLRLNS